MTLEQHIERTGNQCREAAETCWEVGDPIMDDTFNKILREFACNIAHDEDVVVPGK